MTSGWPTTISSRPQFASLSLRSQRLIPDKFILWCGGVGQQSWMHVLAACLLSIQQRFPFLQQPSFIYLWQLTQPLRHCRNLQHFFQLPAITSCWQLVRNSDHSWKNHLLFSTSGLQLLQVLWGRRYYCILLLNLYRNKITVTWLTNVWNAVLYLPVCHKVAMAYIIYRLLDNLYVTLVELCKYE